MKYEYMQVVVTITGMSSLLAPTAVLVRESGASKNTSISKLKNEVDHGEVLHRILNQYGDDGWELVGITSTATTIVQTLFVLKRPKVLK